MERGELVTSDLTGTRKSCLLNTKSKDMLKIKNKEIMKVSKTGEGELLISKNDGKGGYINIIIDDDGDIEIMHIKSNRKETWHKLNVSIDEALQFWETGC